ncbi:MAG: BseRI endonuclease [Promethearchaeota archaeon CR_4]|nr:MAG: BseRI endonuclease [Candidatus Lokiarchaeota archaeon CR_4]
MLVNRPLTPEGFAELFGPVSPIFREIYVLAENNLLINEVAYKRDRVEWVQSFPQTIQNSVNMEDLFIKHAYLVLLVKCMLFCHLFPGERSADVRDFHKIFKVIEERGVKLPNLSCYQWIERIPTAIRKIMTALGNIPLDAGDLFQVIYQQMVSPAARHALGEYYTPPALARLMIKEVYHFGNRTLDPACGSGTFLVEIISQILKSKTSPSDQLDAVANVVGFDVHPIAVIVTVVNIVLQVWNLPASKLPINVSQKDFLFSNLMEHDFSPFDLILGNPPWLVLNGIPSLEYKNRVKDLARGLGIMMGGKYATHTELSSLFYYHGAAKFLKEGGWIFFIATAGLMSGDQHAKFRQFKGLGNTFFWIFDQDIFRIHSICLGVQKISLPLSKRLQVQVVPIQTRNTDRGMVFEKGAPLPYVPCNLDEIGSDDDLVMRLIPANELSLVLPRGTSPYSTLVYQGASFVPRNFLVVDIIMQDAATVTIRPNATLQEKPPWTYPPYKEAKIEKEYIFQAARSLELVPFKLLATIPVFLPIDRVNYQHHPNHLQPLARAHFEALEIHYTSLQKPGASITKLWDRINYNKGVSNPGQRRQLKVIFPGSGTILKAAVISGEIIVDTTCYYYPAKSVEEANYLAGVLNSRSISQDIGRRGSTGAGGGLRHYHKKPLQYHIPLFDSTITLHQKIARKSEEMAHQVENFVKTRTTSKGEETVQERVLRQSRNIQSSILKEFTNDFELLDCLIIQLMKNK